MKAPDTAPDIPAVSTNPARIIKAAVGIALLLAGCGFTIILWLSYQRGMETRSWTETPCTIIDNSTEESGDRTNSEYRLYLRYLYTTDGTTHTGTRWRRKSYQGHRAAEISMKSAHWDQVETLRDKYPSGTRTVCYVNPVNASDAVLEHETKAALYAIWFPMLIALGGAGITWTAIRRKKSDG